MEKVTKIKETGKSGLSKERSAQLFQSQNKKTKNAFDSLLKAEMKKLEKRDS